MFAGHFSGYPNKYEIYYPNAGSMLDCPLLRRPNIESTLCMFVASLVSVDLCVTRRFSATSAGAADHTLQSRNLQDSFTAPLVICQGDSSIDIGD